MMKKTLKVNSASGATLGPEGIAPLELNIDDQTFVHNFVVCAKLKKHLILGLEFAQRYRIGIYWDMYGKLFLRCEDKKIATFMKTNDLEQWTIASFEIPVGKQHETDQKLHFIGNKIVTMASYHIYIAPLKAINHVINNKMKPNSLIEIEERPFLAIEQPDVVVIHMLQKLGHRIPDVYMSVLWNPGGQTVILKRNMTISYVKESDYMEKVPWTKEKQ